MNVRVNTPAAACGIQAAIGRLLLVILVASVDARAQSIFTVAGGGTDDGRPATLAALDRPRGLAVNAAGDLLFADFENNQIRMVSADSGVVSTVAGNGTKGLSGDEGPATRASLSSPQGIVIDDVGRLYIADTSNHRVRRVDHAGVITTVAGRFPGSGGDGGPATEASLWSPRNVALDRQGHLYIVDAGNHRIRRVNGATGIITTVAGDGEWGSSGDGGPATAARLKLSGPVCCNIHVPFTSGIAVDSRGDVYFADPFDHRVRKVSLEGGVITTVAGDGTASFGGDGSPATAAKLDTPDGIAFDAAGDLLIVDQRNCRIRRVARSTGIISTAAGSGCENRDVGDGGPALQAYLSHPSGIALDAEGTALVSEEAVIRRIDADSGVISTIAGSGRITLIDEPGPAIAAQLREPSGLAISPEGDIVVSERDGHRVRRVSAANGMIETVAGLGFDTETPYALGDGGPATEARIDRPWGLAFDASGSLHIATPERVRRVDARTGIITTVAGGGNFGFAGDGGPATEASLMDPSGLVLDREGNLYISDMQNDRVRRVSVETGIIQTVAGNGVRGYGGDGGPATDAALTLPRSLATDAEGNLFIADWGNQRIRKVDATTGFISTVAGGGSRVDGVPATQALLGSPAAVVVDREGNLFIGGANRVSRVDAATSTITTVAGTGMLASFGDLGAATAAGVAEVEALSLSETGDIYFTEALGGRVRVVPACVTVAPVALTSPVSGSSGISQSPLLLWTPPAGAFRYDVLIDKVDPPERVAASDVETTSTMVSGLEPLTRYYWRVVAKGDPYCEPPQSSESEVWSFTTTSSCDVPLLGR